MSTLDEAPRSFGRYRLLDRLATGGMAEIYRALYQGAAGITKPVVIKKILPAFAGSADFVTMFINEAKIVVGLSHGNIAQVFDFGEIDGEYYLAMEYVPGQPLSKVLKKSRAAGMPVVPIPYACLIAAELLAGLHYAHTRLDAQGRPLHIIHRDVSPQNVLVSYEGQVKVVDFGIAKARNVAAKETATGAIKGKYVYFSPEQVLGRELDHRADVYACGVLLYEMVCGRLPIEGKMMEVFGRILRGDFDRPRTVNTNVPGELEEIILRAMATNRDDRFPSAQAMRDALIAFQHGHPTALSSGSLGHFMSFLYEQELVAEGLPVHLPPDYLRELEALRGDGVQVGHDDATLADRGRLGATPEPRRTPQPLPAGRSPSGDTVPLARKPSGESPAPRRPPSGETRAPRRAPSGETVPAGRPPSSETPVAKRPPSGETRKPSGETRKPSGESRRPSGETRRSSSEDTIPVAPPASVPRTVEDEPPTELAPRVAHPAAGPEPARPEAAVVRFPALDAEPGTIPMEQLSRAELEVPGRPLPRWLFVTVPAAAAAVALLLVLFVGFRSAQVELTSTPSSALVLVDGRPAPELTPLVIRGLEPDEEHVIQVTLPDRHAWVQRITPRSGERLVLHADLEPAVPTGPQDANGKGEGPGSGNDSVPAHEDDLRSPESSPPVVNGSPP